MNVLNQTKERAKFFVLGALGGLAVGIWLSVGVVYATRWFA